VLRGALRPPRPRRRRRDRTTTLRFEKKPPPLDRALMISPMRSLRRHMLRVPLHDPSAPDLLTPGRGSSVFNVRQRFGDQSPISVAEGFFFWASVSVIAASFSTSSTRAKAGKSRSRRFSLISARPSSPGRSATARLLHCVFHRLQNESFGRSISPRDRLDDCNTFSSRLALRHDSLLRRPPDHFGAAPRSAALDSFVLRLARGMSLALPDLRSGAPSRPLAPASRAKRAR